LGELGANLYGGELNSGVFDEVNLVNGSLIQLSPGIYTDLYEFTARADGDSPYGNLLFDSAGNLYGTASCGGSCPQGVDGTVYRLTPQ
jgi:uncharacterized repeat protein (TIGR03803 family)